MRSDPRRARPRLAGTLLALTILALPFSGRAHAKRHFVPWDYPTLQAAIEAASPKDTVWISPGVYRGPFTLRKPLVIFGDQGPDSTFLDGGDSVRVLDIQGVTGATLIGLTIRHGRANSGGGIHAAQDTSLMIASCVFTKNWESAISCWQSHDVNLIESRFLENEGSAVSLNASTISMRGNEFRKNRGYAGGAISFHDSRAMFPIRNCLFDSNRAETATGGAIYADSSQILLGDCAFTGNTAAVAGGAVSAMNRSQLSIARGRFVENRAGTGGAVHSDQSTLNVGYSLFVRNEATALGSAAALVGRFLANVNPLVGYNTFYKNVSKEDGPTLWAERVSPEIRKNIFALARGQRAFQGTSSSPLYECNLLHDPTGTALASLPSVDTLVGDPLFCDPEHDDFTLRDLSPAVLARCGPIGALPKKCASFKVVPTR